MSQLSFQQPPRLSFQKHKNTPTRPGVSLSASASTSSLQPRAPYSCDRGAPWGHPAGPRRSPRKAALRTRSRRPGRSRPKPAAATSIAPGTPKTPGHGPAPPRCPQRLRACPWAEQEGGKGLRYKGGSRHPTQLGDGEGRGAAGILHLHRAPPHRDLGRVVRRLKRWVKGMQTSVVFCFCVFTELVCNLFHVTTVNAHLMAIC